MPVHRRIPLLPWLFACLGSLPAAFGCQGKSAPTRSSGGSAEASTPPPVFGKTLDGDYAHLADLAGQVVLLNVWATWCGPCRKEIPALERIHRRYRDQGLVVVGLSIDGSRDEPKVRKLVRDLGVTYPIWLDPTAKVTTVLGVGGYPATFLFDERGTQIWRRDGMIADPDPELESQVQSALARLHAGTSPAGR